MAVHAASGLRNDRGRRHVVHATVNCDYIMTLQEVIQYIGQPVLIVGAVTYIIQKLGEYALDKRLKVYEKELDNKQALLEKEITLTVARTTKLYEDRLSILRDIYKKMVTLDREMNVMTMPFKEVRQDAEKEENERIENAGKAYNDFLLCYTENKVFLTKKLDSHLEKLRQSYFDSYWDYTSGRRFGGMDFKFSYEQAKAASDKVRNQIPPILTEIEVEFRKLLGVEEE